GSTGGPPRATAPCSHEGRNPRAGARRRRRRGRAPGQGRGRRGRASPRVLAPARRGRRRRLDAALRAVAHGTTEHLERRHEDVVDAVPDDQPRGVERRVDHAYDRRERRGWGDAGWRRVVVAPRRGRNGPPYRRRWGRIGRRGLRLGGPGRERGG